MFKVNSNDTLSTWKKNKDKIIEKYNSGLTSQRVSMRHLTKLCINVSLFYEVKCSNQ